MIASYDADAVTAALPMDRCIDLMAEVQVRISRGEIRLPLRQFVSHGTEAQGLLVMPGSLGDGDVFGAKLLSLFPENSAQGRPAIQGSVLLFDPVTGAPMALIDAAKLTALRTAAASGVATRALAKSEAATLAILGYGVQAESHLVAMAKVRKLREVRVWGPKLERAQAFAAKHDVGVPIHAVRGA
ncbi:MAG: ornithine cyclodeaminase family protein, partial [Pseudomonadota bacterium]